MTELTLPLTTDRELIAPIHEANFTVQVAAFRQYQDAESLRNLLQDYGHPSYLWLRRRFRMPVPTTECA